MPASTDLTFRLRRSVAMLEEDPAAAKAAFAAVAAEACRNCGKRHRILTAEMCADRTMTERKLQDRVLYRAKKYGWKVAHAGRAEVNGMWLTPMSAGWPDLTCARAGDRLLFIELKREQGEVEPEQWAWLLLLNACGAAAVVVRPSDLREGRVDALLREGSKL